MKPADSSKPQIASWQTELASGLKLLDVSLDTEQQAKLIDYLALLAKWNRVFNLTAVRDPKQMVSRQLLDSLVILPWLAGKTVLDVGTGAGLPGIPLALAAPDKQFTLLDSNGKKTRFVQQVVSELELANVQVVNERIEAMEAEEGFAVVTSRAFSSLGDFVSLTQGLLAPGGCWLAMKGKVAGEATELPAGYLHTVHPLSVPGAEGERHLVRITVESC